MEGGPDEGALVRPAKTLSRVTHLSEQCYHLARPSSLDGAEGKILRIGDRISRFSVFATALY